MRVTERESPIRWGFFLYLKAGQESEGQFPETNSFLWAPHTWDELQSHAKKWKGRTQGYWQCQCEGWRGVRCLSLVPGSRFACSPSTHRCYSTHCHWLQCSAY